MVGDTFIVAHTWVGHIFCEHFVAFRVWLNEFLLVRLCDSIKIFFLFMTDVIYFLSHEHFRSSICMRIVWCVRLWLCMLLLSLLLIQYNRVFFVVVVVKNVIHNRGIATIDEVLRWKCTCVFEWANKFSYDIMNDKTQRMKCNNFSRENCVFALKAFSVNKTLSCAERRMGPIQWFLLLALKLQARRALFFFLSLFFLALCHCICCSAAFAFEKNVTYAKHAIFRKNSWWMSAKCVF